MDFSLTLVLPFILALLSPVTWLASTQSAEIHTPSPSPAYAPSGGAEPDQHVAGATLPPVSARRKEPEHAAYGVNNGLEQPYQRLTILVAVLFVTTLIVGFCSQYVAMLGCRASRREASGGREELAARRESSGPNEPGEVDLERGADWNRSMDSAGAGLWVFRDIPTLRYSSAKGHDLQKSPCEAVDKKDGGDDWRLRMAQVAAECSVCLSEFEEGEELKGLPRCGHTFHSTCIGKWLILHTTCPVCRLNVLQPCEADDGKQRPERGREVAVDTHSSSPSRHAIDPADSRALHASWDEHMEYDVSEHSRSSSAALYAHFPSSS
ncbi:hypothetical protein KP509_18G058800 [Ceratopteris richardii]|uniref:RING-type E3 ubiquitin transferase n=1 Tax=Ceratopteris richardii TaxID=49495 RepID=A0A8T2ST84_CERRI|nr:hypothetical protein KP509_18G058800 [Ceratopteris richardii]KAH7366010.1 hypothetical protein KP509_18G058800 [Ceratopteris richardii]